MNLYEFEAKNIFAQYGVPIPPSKLITRPQDLNKIFFGYPLTLKCQVLTGGRGKAGGIKFAKSLAEAQKIAPELLDLEIKGCKTQSLLVEPKLNITNEYYLSVTLDRELGVPVFIATSEGGVEVEQAKNVVKMPIHFPYSAFLTRTLAYKIGLNGEALNKFASIADKLYQIFIERDLDLIEINPLVAVEGNELLALDGKIVVNDDSLMRQPYFAGWLESHLVDLPKVERLAKLHGVNLVELDGDIGILCNGAGLTMATMDMVAEFGGKPANFLDAGGGSDQAKTLAALELVNKNPKLKVILLNILGGITACDDVANALVEFVKAHSNVKLVVRLRGNNQEKAKEILSHYNVKLIPDLEEAVKTAIALAS